MPCPDPEKLHDLILGRLGDQQREQIEQHMDRCSVCRMTLAALIKNPGAQESTRQGETISGLDTLIDPVRVGHVSDPGEQLQTTIDVQDLRKIQPMIGLKTPDCADPDVASPDGAALPIAETNKRPAPKGSLTLSPYEKQISSPWPQRPRFIVAWLFIVSVVLVGLLTYKMSNRQPLVTHRSAGDSPVSESHQNPVQTTPMPAIKDREEAGVAPTPQDLSPFARQSNSRPGN